ncbi:hypothetical protein GCM10028791_21560 [Echinicola sediminis]
MEGEGWKINLFGEQEQSVFNDEKLPNERAKEENSDKYQTGLLQPFHCEKRRKLGGVLHWLWK